MPVLETNNEFCLWIDIFISCHIFLIDTTIHLVHENHFVDNEVIGQPTATITKMVTETTVGDGE